MYFNTFSNKFTVRCCILLCVGLCQSTIAQDNAGPAFPEAPQQAFDELMTSMEEPSLSFTSDLGEQSSRSLGEFESVLQQVRALRNMRAQEQQAASKPNLVSTQVNNTSQPDTPSPALPATSMEPPTGDSIVLGGTDQAEMVPEALNNRILENPTEPLLLAQSLFRVQNYQAAYAVLTEIETDELEVVDAVWVKFLRGLALKRLGKVENAAALLREVANERSRYFKSEAKWWLSHYEQIRARTEQRELVLQTATQLLEEANSYVRDQQ